MSQQVIGKIVKSNAHADYVCQIYTPGEIPAPPQPADFAFGSFAAIDLEDSLGRRYGELVGVIYNTLLMNPEFGSLGPRLSPRQELEIFAPDYLQETATLVGVFALGWVDEAGVCHQGIPGLAATVGAQVRRMQAEEIRAFHTPAQGGVQVRYVSLLMGQNNPLATPLLLDMVDRLIRLFPEQTAQLAVLRNNLAWRAIVEPAR